MEEKKQLKNFKCQNPDCGHEFLADEFEALECPVCHTDEIAPMRPPLTKYAGVAALVIVIILIIFFWKGGGGTKFEPKFIKCELKAIVDDKEDQPYVYVLDFKIVQFGKSSFKNICDGKHIISIYPIDNYKPNSNQEPIATKTIELRNDCCGSITSSDGQPGNSLPPPPQAQIKRLISSSNGATIDFSEGAKGATYQFSITGQKGPFQDSPFFPNAECKEYQIGELVIKIDDGLLIWNASPMKHFRCKCKDTNTPIVDTWLQTLLQELASGQKKVGDFSDEIKKGVLINPLDKLKGKKKADKQEMVQIIRRGKISDTLPLNDYAVQINTDPVQIDKVIAGSEGRLIKGECSIFLTNITIYESDK